MQWLDTVCRESLDKEPLPEDPVDRLFEMDRRQRELAAVLTGLAVLGGVLAIPAALGLIAGLVWIARAMGA